MVVKVKDRDFDTEVVEVNQHETKNPFENEEKIFIVSSFFQKRMSSVMNAYLQLFSLFFLFIVVEVSFVA